MTASRHLHAVPDAPTLDDIVDELIAQADVLNDRIDALLRGESA